MDLSAFEEHTDEMIHLTDKLGTVIENTSKFVVRILLKYWADCFCGIPHWIWLSFKKVDGQNKGRVF